VPHSIATKADRKPTVNCSESVRLSFQNDGGANGSGPNAVTLLAKTLMLGFHSLEESLDLCVICMIAHNGNANSACHRNGLRYFTDRSMC
jgi:hypothetical protein